MADIELVIKIPDEIYEQAINGTEYDTLSLGIKLRESVREGVVIPKGHGRLMVVSEDAVKREQCAMSFSCQKWISEVGLSNATVAIIEADKESEDK